MTVKHLLITRYNVKFHGKKYMDKRWLKDRRKLFRNYTFPSVVHARKPDGFMWIILRDVHTLAKEREALDKIVMYLPWIETVYVTHHYIRDLQEYIYNNFHDSHVLTTRLDSDDMIHRDYLERVYNSAQHMNSGYLNFSNGLYIRGKQAYGISLPSNAFISRIERRSVVKTVLEHSHTKAKHDPNYVEVATQDPMWAALDHPGALTKRHGGHPTQWEKALFKG